MTPRFAPNLRWLYTELAIPERFAAARRSGFDAVEFSPHHEISPQATLELVAAPLLAHRSSEM